MHNPPQWLLLKQKHDQARRRVQKVLGLSDLEYNNMQFEYGMMFLHRYLQGHKESIQCLAYTPDHFWPWWINTWAQKDLQWLDAPKSPKGDLSYDALMYSYATAHHPHFLQLYPQRHIVEGALKASKSKTIWQK